MKTRYALPHLAFEVTQACNLTCLHCYNHWRRAGHEPFATTFSQANRTLSRALDTIAFDHITFSGGEPFLADGLHEMVLRCRLAGKSVNVISNGTRATHHDLRLLVDFGVSLFELPLHARAPDIHDRMTGVVGSHQRSVASLRSLVELGAGICAVVVLTRLNQPFLTDTLHYCRELGVRRTMLARFNVGGRGISHLDELLCDRADLRSAFQAADRFVADTGIPVTANVCMPECVIAPSEFPRIPMSSCSADFRQRPITLGANGDLRLCNHSPQVVGNLFQGPLHEIFASEAVTAWDRDVPDRCQPCAHWERCRGGCRAASQQLGQGLFREDPIVERLLG